MKNSIEHKMQKMLSNLQELAENTQDLYELLFIARIYGKLCWANNTNVFENTKYGARIMQLDENICEKCKIMFQWVIFIFVYFC